MRTTVEDVQRLREAIEELRAHSFICGLLLGCCIGFVCGVFAK